MFFLYKEKVEVISGMKENEEQENLHAFEEERKKKKTFFNS